MMNYHQSRRGRLRGRWEPWYYYLYNYLKTGSYRSTPLVVRGEPGGNFPDDLWSWEMSFTKGHSPFRNKEHTLVNKLIQVGAEDTSTAKCLPRKSWGKAPIKSKGVKRCQKCKLLLFDGILFQNAASCRMAGPSSIPKVRPRMKKTYLRRHDCCDQELLNIIENRRSEDLVEDKVKSEPTLGSDHSRREVFGCKGDGF